jgi:hypothetical protein
VDPAGHDGATVLAGTESEAIHSEGVRHMMTTFVGATFADIGIAVFVLD